MKKLFTSIATITLLCIGGITKISNAQCTWHQQLFDGYEYQTPCPDVIPGTTYGTVPQDWAVHSGLYSLYMNFVNCNGGVGTCAGDTVYRRVFEVCPNITNRVTAMLATTFSGAQCNVKIILLDGGGNVLSNTASILPAYAPQWTTFQAAFISSTPTITFILITNTDGAQGGNDLSMDDFQVENCYSLSLGSDTTICTDQTITLDPGSGYTSYLWNDNSTSQTITASSPGGIDTTMMYYVQVINTSSCILNSDTISVSFEICSDIDDVANKSDLFILMDHSTMSLFVHAGTQYDRPVCSIYDITGREIFRSVLNSSDQQVFLHPLQTGVYICTISDSREVIYANRIFVD
jgi:hypothetical protein